MTLSDQLNDIQVAIQAAIKLEMKDEKFIDDLENVLKIAKIGFVNAAGAALHRVQVTKPSIDTVKELIRSFPNALSVVKEFPDAYKFYHRPMIRLPIHSAVRNIDTIKYLPILAKKGIKLEVGGKGMRGGLLVEDPIDDCPSRNTLQLIAHLGDPSDPILYDSLHLDVLKELRKDKLLLKEDIKEHDLLYWSCHLAAKKRFEYLAEWDPDCLINNKYLLSFAFIENFRDLTSFTMYFQTALQYHPKHLGFLFQKDKQGYTVYERIIQRYSKDITFNVIKQCIPTDTKLPILHHVVRDAPQYMNDFSFRYPSAFNLRDEDGRAFKQAALASGSKTSKNNGQFFGMMTDDEIAELDPVTNQYPFLTCAACENSDLSTVYTLLSRNPSLVERYIEQTTHQFAEEARTERRKRKRDVDDDDDDDDDDEE